MVFSCFVYLFWGNMGMQSTNRSIWHCAATWSWPCTCRTYGTRVLLSHQLQGLAAAIPTRAGWRGTLGTSSAIEQASGQVGFARHGLTPLLRP